MRILFVAHHRIVEGAGVGGATLALGSALRAQGHEVSYFGFDDAFASPVSAMRLRFPWRVARMLARSAAGFDVVDATTGDAWVWLTRRAGGPKIVTRAHGLELTAHRELMRRVDRGEASTSWRYSLYSGGYRLWEVRRSLASADGCVVLNATDERELRDCFSIPPSRTLRADNGIPERLLRLPEPTDESARGDPFTIAFIGSWIPRKGISTLAAVAAELSRREIAYRVRVIGSGAATEAVLADFPPATRAYVEVTHTFDSANLPALLNGAHCLLHPSWSEGFSLALAEGMACGLAPVVSTAGAAAQLVRDGVAGIVVGSDADEAYADAIASLAGNRDRLATMRRSAQQAVRHLSWSRIAEELAEFYRRVPGPSQ
jgi:glycosyltransferase involved in cell wall biosynthesis